MGKSRFLYRRVSLTLVLSMVVSLITPMSKHAGAKENDISVATEFVSQGIDTGDVSIDVEFLTGLMLPRKGTIGWDYEGTKSRMRMIQHGVQGTISKITASTTSLSFSNAGGSRTVTISGKSTSGTLRADRNSDASWLTASISGYTLSINVPKNTGYARTGHVDVTDTGNGSRIRFTISQSAGPTPTYKPNTPTPTRKPNTPTPTRKPNTPTPIPKLSVSATSLSFSYSESSRSVTVANNRGTLRADRNSDASWLATSVSGGTVTITVRGNSGAARIGHVDITDTGSGRTVKITVSQAASPTPTPTKEPTKVPVPTPTPIKAPTKVPVATPTPTKVPTKVPEADLLMTSLNFNYTSTSRSVTVSDYKGPLRVDRNSDANWFTASVSGGKVTITVAENSGVARTGYVDITDTGSGRTVKITVLQNAKPAPTPTKVPTTVPQLSASPKGLFFSYTSSSMHVTIKNYTGTLRADRNSDASWLTASVSGGTVTIKVTANPGEQRTGHVDITDTGSGQSIKLTITQGAIQPPTPIPDLVVKPNSASFTSKKSNDAYLEYYYLVAPILDGMVHLADKIDRALYQLLKKMGLL